MNQILSVENNNNNNNNNNSSYNYNNNKLYGSKKKVELKAVVIFFCIILIVFGVFIIANGVFSIKNKTNESEEKNEISVPESKEPEVVVEVVSDTEIKLIISHNKIITKVAYSWNDETPIEQEGKENKNFEISNIEVPPGENQLKIIVTDEDNKQTTVVKKYTSPERPWIKLYSEANAIKFEITSKKNITKLTYYWDNEEPKTFEINTNKTMQTLEVTEAGEHTLNVTATDEDGNVASKTKKIKVVKAPEVKVTTDGEYFIFRASDEKNIEKIVVNINGKEMEREINKKTYEGKVKLSNGENKIIVTVYNSEGITKQAKSKWTKE